MAVQNDPRMYSAGAVALNSQPSVNMYAQLLARKQAKFDAMDAYQRDRISKVNDKGLRDIDRQLFDNSLSEIYGNYTTNKDKILKGGNKEAFEYETKWRTPKEILSKSQVSAATHEAAMKLYNERFKRKDVMPKGFMEELALNDLPVDDPNYKLFDLKKWVQDPPPLNMPSFLKNFSGIEREGVRYDDIPEQPLKQNEVRYFKDGSLSAIKFIAANIRDEDYGFATQLEKEYEDPVARKKMIDVFTKAYGTPPATMDDYAAAFALETLQLEKAKPVDNKKATIDYRFKNQQVRDAVMQKYKQANIILSANVRGSSGEMTPPPKYGENYDLTERFQGLKVGNLAGTPEVAQIGSKIIYNPNTKTVTYKDFAGNEKTKSFQQFYDDIATINTVQDLKIVKEVMNSIESPKTVQKNNQTAPPKKRVYNPKTGKFE